MDDPVPLPVVPVSLELDPMLLPLDPPELPLDVPEDPMVEEPPPAPPVASPAFPPLVLAPCWLRSVLLLLPIAHVSATTAKKDATKARTTTNAKVLLLIFHLLIVRDNLSMTRAMSR
jgi:hypothetical protein